MAYEGCKSMSLLYVFDKVDMAKTWEQYYFMGHRRYLPMDHLFRNNRRMFDGKQELECALKVPN